MRVDKFVIQHLNYLDGKLKLAYAEHNKNIISDPDFTKPRSDFTIKSVSIEEKTRTYISNKTSLNTITTENEQVTVNDINKKQISLNEIERERKMYLALIMRSR